MNFITNPVKFSRPFAARIFETVETYLNALVRQMPDLIINIDNASGE